MMSVEMEQAADAILQAAGHISSQDELSELDVDGDGSSSLSDIEDKDPEQDEDAEGSDELSNPSDEENDSEAETERLEESPNKIRTQKDVILTPHDDSRTYERSPSKLHNQTGADDPEDEEDDEPLSDDDMSVNESPGSMKSSAHEDVDNEVQTVPTSLEDSSVESRKTLSVADVDSRKRKRSIMAGSGLDDDLDEPSRKRTGSILTPRDDYAIEEDTHIDEEGVTTNTHEGNISGDEGDEVQEEEAHEDAEEVAHPEDEPQELVEAPPSPKRRGRKKKKVTENGVIIHLEAENGVNGVIVNINGHDTRNGEEDTVEHEGDDEAEAAQRNEEELERKRIALDQLGAIERQFATFRDRLYDERLEQLNREETMLRQKMPTHPDYLAMMQCIDTRRDERIRVGDKRREYGLQTLKTYAVGKRSQILVQFQQEVRELRENALEQSGKHWYEIQHDRRSYAGSVPDYTLKFPKRRSQQVMNQVAYSNEVSILSGIAKYVGFPAAPQMLSASAAEMEEDFEKMGRTKQALQPTQAALPLHELAALRSGSLSTRSKPAEEQFIEQNPWANPKHPSHALLQRQASTTPRTKSPFSQVQTVPRRHSHQSAGPIAGSFSNTPINLPGGRLSPHNPFTNTHQHTTGPSPLGSPQQNRPVQTVPEQRHSMPSPKTSSREFPQEARQQATAIMGQF